MDGRRAAVCKLHGMFSDAYTVGVGVCGIIHSAKTGFVALRTKL